MLRLILQDEPEQIGCSIIRVYKLKILLSLLAIPIWTTLYVDDIMTYAWALPVSFYIAGITLLVFDVLREYNGLVEAKRRIREEETIDSPRD